MFDQVLYLIENDLCSLIANLFSWCLSELTHAARFEGDSDSHVLVKLTRLFTIILLAYLLTADFNHLLQSPAYCFFVTFVFLPRIQRSHFCHFHVLMFSNC